ncbi:hypothetical protein V502_01524 [Pseudogymnoascus sp. VKM F-4520 (FW-2644)]|nr:hypothetical protein V502_01524 [Pseudogymnoascus sp. VKM F-4520 (FW-2644)]
MRPFLFSLLGLGRLTAAVVVTTDNGFTHHGQGHDHDDYKTCVVIPLGHSQDDVPNILAAVDKCGAIPGGRIVLPAPYVYSINQRMTTHLENSTLEVSGTLHFSDDLAYWIENSYRFDFQNQSTAWRITGSDYVVDGGPGMGGIDGNGQTWYTWAKNAGNVFGRPMPLHIVNSTRATFRNLSIRQQQFWAVLVETSSYIELDNFYVNATNSDHAADSGGGEHYVQNTDGIDIYRSDHISITNWVYQGGDDAVALKGNSTNIHIENITVYGGPGIAFGSLGQYPDRYDIVENVTVKNIKVQPSFQNPMKSGVYFKSWIGVNYGYPPNGGGGGSGHVRNVSVDGVVMVDVEYPIYISTCLSYLSTNVTQYCDTSTFSFSDMHFNNISGTSLATPSSFPGHNITFDIALLCSKEAPCDDLTFSNIDIKAPASYSGLKYLCANAEVEGLACNT